MSPVFNGALFILYTYCLLQHGKGLAHIGSGRCMSVMRLLLDKSQERSPFPRVRHRGNVCSLYGGANGLSIKFFRGFIPHWNSFQMVDIRIVYTPVQGAVESLNDHDFSPLTVVYLLVFCIQQPVILVLKLDAVPAVYGSLL